MASIVALSFQPAHAQSWSLIDAKYSDKAWAVHETFDKVTTDSMEALDLDWSGVGGTLLSETILKKSYKPGTKGNFLSISGWATRLGIVTIDLSDRPVNYYGFRWGSLDFFNTVSFYSGGKLILSVTGDQVEDRYEGVNIGYFGVLPGKKGPITKVVMESSRSSFETDNHAVRFAPVASSIEFSVQAPALAVPEPATYGMFLAGLGLVGVVTARRRRAKQLT
jgi:hypothetical protein